MSFRSYFANYEKVLKLYSIPAILIGYPVLMLGVLSSTLDHNKWLIAIFIHLLPLLLIIINKRLFIITGVWTGIFLISQYFLSVFIFGSNFKNLQPNIQYEVAIHDGLDGVYGKQRISTDEKGFRVTKKIHYFQKPDAERIFTIGGSTTEQIMLDNKKTWSHLLQQKLEKNSGEKYEVINTGVSGLRAKHHLATLKHISQYSPNVAIILLGFNDWNHFIRNGWSSKNSKFVKFEDTMLGNMLFSVFRTVINLMRSEQPEKFYIKQMGLYEKKPKKEFFPDDVPVGYSQVINQIGEFCHASEIKCVFVSQPTMYSKNLTSNEKSRLWMTPPRKDYALTMDSLIHVSSLFNGYLESYTENNQQIFCDAAALIKDSSNFYDDCHLNEKGSKKLAQVIFECIT